MMAGGMAAEIAAAAAARERRNSCDSFDDLNLEDAANAAATDTRARNHTLMSRRPTPPKILPQQQQDKQQLPKFQAHLRQPSEPSDPPGWNSKWAPNSEAWKKQQALLRENNGGVQHHTFHTLPYRPPHNHLHGAIDEVFHAPLQSWVPLVEKEKREGATKYASSKNLSSTTTWLQNEATRSALDRTVPVNKWHGGSTSKRPRPPKQKVEQTEETTPTSSSSASEPISHSWAPHLHPKGPQAALLEASLTSVGAAASKTRQRRHVRGRPRQSKDTTVSSYSGVTMIDDDDEDSRSSHSQSEEYEYSIDSESGSSTMIEVVSEDDTSHNQRNKKPNSKLTMASSILSGGSAYYEEEDHSTMRSRSASKGSIDHSKGGSTDDDNESSERDDKDLERQINPRRTDATTFLVDADDTFQVFDEDWNFAPSRGTLCVMCLCIVVVLQGVAIGLYFALR